MPILLCAKGFKMVQANKMPNKLIHFTVVFKIGDDYFPHFQGFTKPKKSFFTALNSR